MKHLFINRKGDAAGTGGNKPDATATANLIKDLLIEHPEPPNSLEELFGLLITAQGQIQRCRENGQLAKIRAWLVFLSVKTGAAANGLHVIPLDLPNPYFIEKELNEAA